MDDLTNYADRLSQEAVTAVQVGSAESRDMDHWYLGVEHLVLGLLNILSTDLEATLKAAGFVSSTFCGALRRELGHGPSPKWGRRLIVTPRLRLVFGLADKIASHFGEREVRPAHLLLAILVEGESLPARLLQETGSSRKLRDKLLERCGQRRARVATMTVDTGASLTPALSRFGSDFTALAREGKLRPVIGRSRELLDVVHILARQTKCNPLLVGDPGVGKTCIVEGLAQLALSDGAPSPVRGKRIIGLTMSTVLGGTAYRGEFEERLNAIVHEATTSSDVILFIDELHTVMGAGAAAGGPLDAANALKPALSRGDLRCIGATTTDEYQKYIARDGALERRFEVIRVDEPTAAETLEILKGLRPSLGAHHGVAISDEALESAIHLGSCYLTDRRFPDKALDLVDRACAETRFLALCGADSTDVVVDALAVARVVSRQMSIPVESLSRSDDYVLLGLEDTLRSRVLGQPEAVSIVAQTIVASRSFGSRTRPVSVFLFVGPSGVGKTELAVTVCCTLFGSDRHLVRLDMSEYMERHEVARLVGSPPGYIGHDEEGQLTGAVRRHPHCVVLLDEIEKAHPDAVNIFLQMFDSGRLTDSKGRTADFSHAVVIMTSNVGVSATGLEVGIRQQREDDRSASLERDVRRALERSFRTEFLNRVDEVVFFHPLSQESLRGILAIYLREVESQLETRRVRLEMTDGARDLLVERGTSPQFGARELRRTVDRLLRKPLAHALLSGSKDTFTVHVVREGDTLQLEKREDLA